MTGTPFMPTRRYFTLVLILGLLTCISPFSIDMYLPGFQDIASNLHTSVARVSLSLSSYFIGISAGQLLYGPLLDRYGRKKPMYVGLIIYVLASGACALAHHIDILILLRFVQAIGGCGADVAALAMIRDIFGPKESARVFSLLLLVIASSPMLAPSVGSGVIALYGWRSVFVILLIVTLLIMVISAIVLRESYPPDENFSLRPVPIIKNFIAVLRVPAFFRNALAGSLAFAGLFAYVSSAPYVFMGIYRVDKKTFGWIFAILSVGFIGLSQLNSLLLRKYSSKQIIRVVLPLQVLIAVIFLCGYLAGGFGLIQLMVILFFLLGCMGIGIPNASALSLAPFDKNAGTASSIMGAMQMGIGALGSVGISLLANGTIMPMIVVMCVSSVLAFLVRIRL